jgi:hypothetical protein
MPYVDHLGASPSAIVVGGKPPIGDHLEPRLKGGR